jgi:hypothetical protein
MRYSLQRYSLFFFLQHKKSTAPVFLYKGSAFLFFGMTHTTARTPASYKLTNAYLQVANATLATTGQRCGTLSGTQVNAVAN